MVRAVDGSRPSRKPAGADDFAPRVFGQADRAVHQSRDESMMARTKRGRRSYSAGEWGRNRVRVFPDPKTGLLQIEWRENGRRLSRSLKHRDWARAKRQADEAAAGFAVYEPNGRRKPSPSRSRWEGFLKSTVRR